MIRTHYHHSKRNKFRQQSDNNYPIKITIQNGRNVRSFKLIWAIKLNKLSIQNIILSSSMNQCHKWLYYLQTNSSKRSSRERIDQQAKFIVRPASSFYIAFRIKTVMVVLGVSTINMKIWMAIELIYRRLLCISKNSMFWPLLLKMMIFPWIFDLVIQCHTWTCVVSQEYGEFCWRQCYEKKRWNQYLFCFRS